MKYIIQDIKTDNRLAGIYETIQEAKEAVESITRGSFGPDAGEITPEELQERAARFEIRGALGDYPPETYRHLAEIEKKLREERKERREEQEIAGE